MVCFNIPWLASLQYHRQVIPRSDTFTASYMNLSITLVAHAKKHY